MSPRRHNNTQIIPFNILIIDQSQDVDTLYIVQIMGGAIMISCDEKASITFQKFAAIALQYFKQQYFKRASIMSLNWLSTHM